MRHENFMLITSFIFAMVALAHFSRIAYGWDVVIAGYNLPMFISYLGLFIGLSMAWFGYKFSRR